MIWRARLGVRNRGSRFSIFSFAEHAENSPEKPRRRGSGPHHSATPAKIGSLGRWAGKQASLEGKMRPWLFEFLMITVLGLIALTPAWMVLIDIYEERFEQSDENT